MAPEDETRRSRRSGGETFDGRDLLVGRPEEGGGRPSTGAAGSPSAITPPRPDALDDAIAEILATVRAMAT